MVGDLKGALRNPEHSFACSEVLLPEHIVVAHVARERNPILLLQDTLESLFGQPLTQRLERNPLSVARSYDYGWKDLRWRVWALWLRERMPS